MMHGTPLPVRTLLLAAFLAALLAAFLAAGITGSSLAQQPPDWTPPPPPPLREEVRPAIPDTTWVWRPGHWMFIGREYVWSPGEWVPRPIRGEHWMHGYWAQSGEGGWIWIPGHWQP
jgi:hypothetical protein